MKYFAVFFLLWSGLFGGSAAWAEEAASDEAYQASMGSDGVQHVSILGGSYFFRPKRIVVKVNVPVELEVSLEQGVIPHTLVITAPEAGIAVNEKLSTDVKKIRFTPTAAGKYPFYCSSKLLFFESHRQKGMEGMLEVAL
ncbi:quinol oxidase [Rhodoferax ferrireducens]|uniref:quinol oxidase n=1 Tax=Rhodoferax ferrireducens TaxID=192843 RepID=UPI000E0DE2C9|nr:quinol oxidase [Rhodoferax ferrireducens]